MAVLKKIADGLNISIELIFRLIDLRQSLKTLIQTHLFFAEL